MLTPTPTPPTARAVSEVLEVLQLAHDTMHECTAVLPANDCAKVAQVMAQCRAVLASAPALSRALATMVYETTHLSPCEPDGSHWCKISGEALGQARAALRSVATLARETEARS